MTVQGTADPRFAAVRDGFEQDTEQERAESAGDCHAH